MGNFSSRQDFYVHSLNNSQIQEFQDQIMIRFVCDENFTLPVLFANPFQKLISQKDETQKISILGLQVIYICNETKHNLVVELQDIFEVPNKKNEDSNHIDDTGLVKILCPANFNGSVSGNDQILYRPRLHGDIIRKYAGLNVLDINVKPLNKEEKEDSKSILELSHPLVYFILNNEEKLQEFGSVDLRPTTENFVKLETLYLNRVKEFFKNTIYDDLRTTRFEDLKIVCDPPKNFSDEIQNKKILPNLTVLIQINYLLINPSLQIKHKEYKF